MSDPWARDDGGFRLGFEALLMLLMQAMPVDQVAMSIDAKDIGLWRVLYHHVDDARAQADQSEVTRVAFDETAARRRHDYLILLIDLGDHRVLFFADVKDVTGVVRFFYNLAE